MGNNVKGLPGSSNKELIPKPINQTDIFLEIHDHLRQVQNILSGLKSTAVVYEAKKRLHSWQVHELHEVRQEVEKGLFDE